MGACFALSLTKKAFALALFLACAPADPAAHAAPQSDPKAGIVQQLGSSVTMNLAFRDERGNAITLQEAAGGKPFVLALVYYRCPMLCNLILGGLLETLVTLGPSAGEEFSVVTASFDPSEGSDLAAAKKGHYLRAYGRPSAEAGWRFLSDASGSAERLCRETGFRISYDPVSRQYAHASAILVLTPEGKISRYFMGVNYPARDLRLALVEASQGRIGTVSDQLLLLCYRYDAAAGKYTLAVWRMLRVAGAATVIGIGLLVLWLSRRRARPAPARVAPGSPPSVGGA
jgi:protein SCO1/2